MLHATMKMHCLNRLHINMAGKSINQRHAKLPQALCCMPSLLHPTLHTQSVKQRCSHELQGYRFWLKYVFGMGCEREGIGHWGTTF